MTRAVTPRTKAARPLFARCVLHAGSAKRSGQKVKLPDGGVQSAPPQLECAFDAECVRREVDAGAAGGDDGFASLQCKGRQCICRLIAVRKQGRPEAVYEESFELEDGCGDPELSRRLLEEICMRGMPRALNSKRP